MVEIRTEKSLRELIGKAPPGLKIKKLKRLEHHSQNYLEMSRLIALTSKALPTNILLIASQTSHLKILSPNKFRLEITEPGLQSINIQNASCGLYVLASGLQESLRINGRLSSHTEDQVTSLDIEIQEHYFHCAKSIMRSEFWTPLDGTVEDTTSMLETDFDSDEVQDFLQNATFLLLASENTSGERDLSPRGDPAGFVRKINDTTVFIPERPGNRIADSLTNILTNPEIALHLFIPGRNQSLILTGLATLTSSHDLLKASQINNKAPKLGILLEVQQCFYGYNPALKEMDLWNEEHYIDRTTFPSLGKIIAEQLQASNKVPGKKSLLGRALGKAAGAAADVAIKNDYKKNLY